jgi:short-subunit dehydrogenase
MSKSILITGASSGLGEEMARQFAAAGYDLALCARRAGRLSALQEEIERAHPGQRCEVRALDVTDDDQVFEVFRAFHADLGRIDRVVVNAGLSKGAALGTGGHHANRQTAMTNFVGALAQADAAMEIFRAQRAGHLVVVSSMSALRGLPSAVTTYAATKAAVAHLAEGLRMELLNTPIKVTVIYPGYIHSEMNPEGTKAPFIVSAERGVRAIVDAVEREKPRAYVPPWPWTAISHVMKHLPLPLAKRMMS